MTYIVDPYRFGSAFTDPTDISGLVLWLDAADITTLWQDTARTTQVASDSDPVFAWDDKSGNANHWSRSSSGCVYQSTGYNTSYATVDCSSNGWLAGSLSESSGQWTIFAAAVPSNTTSGYLLDIITGRFIIGYYSTGSSFGYYDGGWKAGTKPTAGQPYIWVISNGDMTSNGTTIVTNTQTDVALGGANQRLGGWTGGAVYWQGNISSLIIYSGNLSAGDVANVEGYLKTRYGMSY